jgi:hypothetical protein
LHVPAALASQIASSSCVEAHQSASFSNLDDAAMPLAQTAAVSLLDHEIFVKATVRILLVVVENGCFESKVVLK